MLFQAIKSRSKKEKGFTLLEMMIAIAVLTFGILAVASMQVSSIRGNFFAGNTTEAKTWAGDQQEDFRGNAYGDLVTGFDPTPPPGYAVNWVVNDNTPIPETKTINLTISWTAGLGRKRVTLSQILPSGL